MPEPIKCCTTKINAHNYHVSTREDDKDIQCLNMMTLCMVVGQVRKVETDQQSRIIPEMKIHLIQKIKAELHKSSENLNFKHTFL